MNILIVYKSRHGSTQKSAQLLADKLIGNVQLYNLGVKGKLPDLNPFEMIIIGGSIHAGIIQGKVRQFCKKHNDLLLTKKLGLFLCCMDKARAEEQFVAAFLPEHREKAIAKGIFGGEFLFDKMNWLERSVVKNISKVNASVSEINLEAIQDFAEKVNGLNHLAR